MSKRRFRPANPVEWAFYGLHDGRPRYLYERDQLVRYHFRQHGGIFADGPSGEVVALHSGPFDERHEAADLIARLAGFLKW